MSDIVRKTLPLIVSALWLLGTIWWWAINGMPERVVYANLVTAVMWLLLGAVILTKPENE